jgi:chromosome segregation ATPase
MNVDESNLCSDSTDSAPDTYPPDKIVFDREDHDDSVSGQVARLEERVNELGQQVKLGRTVWRSNRATMDGYVKQLRDAYDGQAELRRELETIKRSLFQQDRLDSPAEKDRLRRELETDALRKELDETARKVENLKRANDYLDTCLKHSHEHVKTLRAEVKRKDDALNERKQEAKELAEAVDLAEANAKDWKRNFERARSECSHDKARVYMAYKGNDVSTGQFFRYRNGVMETFRLGDWRPATQESWLEVMGDFERLLSCPS